jgi:hypothetical protein
MLLQHTDSQCWRERMCRLSYFASSWFSSFLKVKPELSFIESLTTFRTWWRLVLQMYDNIILISRPPTPTVSLFSVAPTLERRASVKRLFHFSFYHRQSVGLLGLRNSPSQDRYLLRATQTQNKRRQTSMPWVGFEPTITVIERAKSFYSLDRAATVVGWILICVLNPGKFLF